MLVELAQEYPKILACQSHRLHHDQSEIYSMKELMTVLHTTQAFIQIIKESESEELRSVNCSLTLLVSPVRNHPSVVNSFAVASGLPQYSLKCFFAFVVYVNWLCALLFEGLT